METLGLLMGDVGHQDYRLDLNFNMNESSCTCCFGCFNRRKPDTVVFDPETRQLSSGRVQNLDMEQRVQELASALLAYRVAKEGDNPALFECARLQSEIEFAGRVQAVRKDPKSFRKYWITQQDDQAIENAKQYILNWAPAAIELKWKICDGPRVKRSKGGNPIVKGGEFTDKERSTLRKDFTVEELRQLRHNGRKTKLDLEMFRKLIEAAEEAETVPEMVQFDGTFNLARILDDESMLQLNGACTVNQLAARYQAAKNLHQLLRKAKFTFEEDQLRSVANIELPVQEFANLRNEFSKGELEAIKAEKKTKRLSANILARLSKVADAEEFIDFDQLV